MPPRAILRSSISFGLVSIPVELFAATESKAVHFNLLHAKDNSRIQEKIYCVAENKQIDRSELVHGFPIQKGKYVAFTNDELKKLESGAGHEIDIVQFIPISEVDPVYFVASYLLGSTSGSAKAYGLLNAAMTKSQRAAVAKFVMRGKEHLALIRPFRDALILHTMHYADEIRSTDKIEHGGKTAAASEMKLAERLIDDLSQDRFKPEEFKDSYRERVLAIAKQKAAGEEITVSSPPKRGKVIDLMTALKNSLKNQAENGAKSREESGDTGHRSKEHAHRGAKGSRRPARRRRASA
jgi:DNA end-binding protein Ku